MHYKLLMRKRNSIFASIMGKSRILIFILLLTTCTLTSVAQISKGNFDRLKRGNFNPGYEQQNNRWNEIDNDTIGVSSKTDIPEGIYAWRVDPIFGDIVSADLDTIPHNFQNQGSTKGLFGGYLSTGNLGAPRKALRLSHNNLELWQEQFVFMNPYDFFIERAHNQSFTNTKSPFTNITYHECGDKEHGEDRISALFAVNAGKKIGLGFNLDYLYGRGYYQSQNTAHFRADIYGSYIGERYKSHLSYRLQYMKTTENGGLEDDRYITEPEAFANNYETWEMPTNLSKTWNKINVNSLFFTQRFNVGKVNIVNDSTSTDSLKPETLSPITGIPPLTVSHSMQIDHDDRLFLSNITTNNLSPLYFRDYYFAGDSASDKTKHFAIRNTVAIELNENWKKWLKAGARLYVSHKHERFTLPNSPTSFDSYRYNYFNIGAELMHRKGKILDYNLLGELRTRDGKQWGEFKLLAKGGLRKKLFNDTCWVNVYAQLSSEEPNFYFRHYQGRNAWWDNEGLNKTLYTRIGAEFKYKKTKFTLRFEQQNDATYIQEKLYDAPRPRGNNDKLHSISAIQNGKPVQRFEASIYHWQTWGILNWENELTYQTTSDKSLSPVPAFMAYSNLFLKFRIAKVLNTELGADVRYYTRFTPQVYSPIIGQYVLQDERNAEKIGGYPILNAYANLHLKRTRFYIMASHINASQRQKKAFELPHYPMNGFTLHLGISWNFIN